MSLPILNLSTLQNLAVFILEQDNEKLSRVMQTFAKNKEQVQIVTNERSKHMYESVPNVQTTYDPNKYEAIRGTTFIFDDCFDNCEWMRDKKLHDWISYPRMLGLTSVLGFRHLYGIPPRMCWNLDLICIGANPSPTIRKNIHDSFFFYLLSFEELCELLDTYTAGDGFLVLRREGTEDKLYHANA